MKPFDNLCEHSQTYLISGGYDGVYKQLMIATANGRTTEELYYTIQLFEELVYVSSVEYKIDNGHARSHLLCDIRYLADKCFPDIAKEYEAIEDA